MPYTPMQLAEAFIQTGELADALQAIDQQLGARPDDDHARRLRAAVLLRLDALADALHTLDQLAVPGAADHAQRAIILERGGDLPGALAAMRAAHEADPADSRLTERYIRLLSASGEHELALALARSQPRTWRWLQWEGDLLAQSGDDRMATARYGLALAQLEAQPDEAAAGYLAPLRARLLLARAHAYRRLGEYALAGEHYAAADDIMPNDPAIPFYRGLIHAAQGDSETAEALCRAALQQAAPEVAAGLRAELADDEYGDLRQRLDSQAGL
jgi:tetratricopeptide (TPR) repeat protein